MLNTISLTFFLSQFCFRIKESTPFNIFVQRKKEIKCPDNIDKQIVSQLLIIIITIGLQEISCAVNKHHIIIIILLFYYYTI